MANKPCVMIVGAGILQTPMATEARKLGYAPIMTDGNPSPPGKRLAHRFYHVDTYDVAGHVALAKRLRREFDILGVATCGADVAPTVAATAKALGLPGIPLTKAMITHNKYSVRKAIEEAGGAVYQPDWAPCRLHDNYVGLAETFMRLWGSIVVKPLSERASRGVTICERPKDIEQAIEAVRPYTDDMFLVEKRLYGTEHSAEIIFDQGGEPIFFNVVDRAFSYVDGHALEVGHINPSQTVRTPLWDACREAVLFAAKALGVAWGPFKCDLMITPENAVKILECTARLSGGFDCQATTPLATMRNPIAATLLLACGEDTTKASKQMHELCPHTGSLEHQYAACHAILPPPGRVIAPPVLKQMQLKYPQLHDIIFLARRNDTVGPYTHCATRPGFVIASAGDYEDAWTKARLGTEAIAKEFKIANNKQGEAQ